MNTGITYLIIAVILLVAELIYFRIADKCNIIDKPNERSSHSTIVLRGGGVIFAISMVIWLILQMVQGEGLMVNTELLDRLKEFMEDEARSCSMDSGGITPLYVYRMWGGRVLDG